MFRPQAEDLARLYYWAWGYEFLVYSREGVGYQVTEPAQEYGFMDPVDYARYGYPESAIVTRVPDAEARRRAGKLTPLEKAKVAALWRMTTGQM